MIEIDIIKELIKYQKDIVVVGGLSEVLQGFRESTKDIDICVTHLGELHKFAPIKEWNDTSAFSVSGKRAGMNTGHIIDIFIEEELPEYVIIEGIKCQTIKSLIKTYTRTKFKLTKPEDKNARLRMDEKIKNLKRNIIK